LRYEMLKVHVCQWGGEHFFPFLSDPYKIGCNWIRDSIHINFQSFHSPERNCAVHFVTQMLQNAYSLGINCTAIYLASISDQSKGDGIQRKRRKKRDWNYRSLLFNFQSII